MNESAKPQMPGVRTAGMEWKAYWTLPLAAMIGYSTIGLQSYGIGPFVTSLENEFGWTRSQVMLGLSLSNAVGVFLNILVGMIVDRFGPRRVAITGLFVKTGAFALLGTATGALLNWSLLWVLIAVGVVLVQSTVWTAAVATRFDRSRGLAFAVTLSGSAVTATVVPILATWLISDFGWRAAFAGVGAAWLLVTLPVVLLLFRDARSERRRESTTTAAAADTPPPEIAGMTLAEGMRTGAFARLVISFGTFSFYSMAIASNLLPLLMEAGTDVAVAARIAAIMGIVGIVARLSVGYLLDRLPANVIGGISQFLPVLGCALLLAEVPGTWPLIVAVATFGIATGAEMDVTIYLASRHFGLKAFAALFGAVITVGAVAAAVGPIVAGWLHDLTGNYNGLLICIMVLMTCGAISLATMRPPVRDFSIPGH